MLGLGFGEIIIIALVAFLALGPEKLPAFLKQLGSLVAEVKRVRTEIKEEIDDSDIPSPLPYIRKPAHLLEEHGITKLLEDDDKKA